MFLALRLPEGESVIRSLFLAAMMGFLSFGAREAMGVTYRLSALTGTMQQPTSSYYHFVYGVQADVGAEKEFFFFRTNYFERPVYRSMGFIDKDYGWVGLIGGKLTSHKNHGLYAFGGAGKVSGFVKHLSQDGQQVMASRTYALNSFAASIEYGFKLGPFFGGIQHQTVIGFADRYQTEAYVAWPFNLFLLSMGAEL